jgi:hypothetical protein
MEWAESGPANAPWGIELYAAHCLTIYIDDDSDEPLLGLLRHVRSQWAVC